METTEKAQIASAFFSPLTKANNPDSRVPRSVYLVRHVRTISERSDLSEALRRGRREAATRPLIPTYTSGTKRKNQPFRLRTSISGTAASRAIFPARLSHFIREGALAVDMCPAYQRRYQIREDFRSHSAGPAS